MKCTEHVNAAACRDEEGAFSSFTFGAFFVGVGSRGGLASAVQPGNVGDERQQVGVAVGRATGQQSGAFAVPHASSVGFFAHVDSDSRLHQPHPFGVRTCRSNRGQARRQLRNPSDGSQLPISGRERLGEPGGHSFEPLHQVDDH